MPEQLSFDLPVRPALGREDFFVSPANALALSLIETWPNWPGNKLLLAGPEGSGKTHLAHVWAAIAKAQIISAHDLADADIPALAKTPVAVEDVPSIRANAKGETALFHLHNLLLSEGHSLLLTGRGDPAHWEISLPDLASRMQGTTTARLDPPDDMLLTAVMAKLLADRQLRHSPDTIPSLLRHGDRSFAAAHRIVTALDKASLDLKRPITRALARDVLQRMSDEDVSND